MAASTTVGKKGPFGPLDRPEPWNTWWVWLWGLVAVGLLVMIAAGVPFLSVWLPCAVVGFGGMETLGLLRPHDPYPPLTQVIRQYVPRWAAFTLIYGFTGMAAGTWLLYPDRLRLAALVGVLGWFTAHFDTTFDNQAALEENRKYAWYAMKLGRNNLSATLLQKQEIRAKSPLIAPGSVPAWRRHP